MSGGGAVASSGAATDKALQNLVSSTLWIEDQYQFGHHSVWGSRYDTDGKRWGYACCQCVNRSDRCINAQQDSSSKKRRLTSFIDPAEQAFGWSNPPMELLPKDKVIKTAKLLRGLDAKKNTGVQQGEFVAHFLQYVQGAWCRMLGGQLSGKTSFGDWFCPGCKDLQFSRNAECRRCGTQNPNPQAYKELKAGEDAKKKKSSGLDRMYSVDMYPVYGRTIPGVKKELAPKSNILCEAATEIPKDCDNTYLAEAEAGASPFLRQLEKNQADPEIVSQLDELVSLAVAGEYADAGAAWSKCYRQFCDPVRHGDGDTSRTEEESFRQKLMKSVRKFVQFCEVIRPNPDPDKAFPKLEEEDRVAEPTGQAKSKTGGMEDAT